MDNGTLTTGQVGRLCGVSLNLVKKWIDRGLLQGPRLPGSKHRRIRPSDLARFMVQYEMPIPESLRPYVATQAR